MQNNPFKNLKSTLESNPEGYIRQLFNSSNYQQKGKRFYFDTPSFDSWDYNSENNICTDFRTGEVFDMIGLFAKLYCNDNQGEALKQIQAKIGSNGDITTIKNDGSSVADMAKYIAVEVPELLKLGIHNNKKNQAVFPYYLSQESFNNGKAEYKKVRTSLTGNPKYIFDGKVKTQKLIPYFTWLLDSWLAENKTDILFILEGETDAIFLNTNGYCSLGISGASSLTQSLENPEIQNKIKQFKQIYFIIENDAGGGTFLEQAKKLSPELLGVSKVIALPLEEDILEMFRGIRGADLENKVLKLISESVTIDTAIADPEPIFFGEFKNFEIPKNLLADIPYFKMADEVAKSTQAPYELAVGISLVLASTMFQKKYKVQIKPDWQTNLNLWLMVLLTSGGGKSPVLTPLIKPFLEFEEQERKRIDELNKPIKRKNELLQKQIELHKKSLNQDGAVDALSDKIARLEKQMQKEFQPLRLFARNTTIEAFLNLMSLQQGKMTVISDEGIGFLENICGRYNKGEPQDSDLNSCWDAQDLYIDRMAKGETIIRKPTASVCLLIQDDKFKNFKSKQALADSGHINRYLMISTKQNQGHRVFNEDSIPVDTVKNYADFIMEKLSIKPEVNEGGEIIAKTLKFTTEAKNHFAEMWQGYENSTAQGSANSESYIANYINKIKANLARVAGVIHCLKHSAPEQELISLETLNIAKVLCDIFLDNFKQIFELMELDDNQQNAISILDWLKTNKLDEFEVQKLWQAKKKGKFKNMEIINKALQVLLERQFIFEAQKKPLKFRVNNHFLRK